MENKRSLKYLVVASCLALLIASIGGIVVGASSSPAASDIQILGATLDLNDEVAIGYVVAADAVGYNTSDGTVQYHVHTYNYNPTGTADEGTKLTNYVYKDYSAEEGDEYVIFITEGYPVAQYADDVFARVIEGDKVGAVKKAGVYELSQLMLGQKSLSTDAKNLIGALVKYHDAAYKVLNGTASPYKFVTVSDGYIVEDGFEYTSAVVAAGDTITLAEKIDSASKGAVLTGWTDGTNVSQSSVVTVSASGNYAPQYQFISDVAYNPFMTQWRANYYSDADNTVVSNGSVGNTYWSAAVAGVKAMGEANAVRYIDIYQATTHAKGYADLTRYVFRDAETGAPVLKYSFHKDPPNYDEESDKIVDTYAGMGNTQGFNFNNIAVAGQYLDVNFSLMFPSIDKDGDNIFNEANAQKPVYTYDDEDNKVVETPHQQGDWFTNATNDATIRLPIGLSNDKTNTSAASANLLYLNFYAKRENGIVTGFYLGTSGGESTSQADKNVVSYSSQVYSLDEYYNFTARIFADNNGAVSAVTIYVNGTPVATRTAAAGNSKEGLSYMTWDGSLKLTGEGAAQYVGFNTTAVGRYNGDYYIKDFGVSTGKTMTAAEVEAAPVVSATVTDTVFPALHSKATTATIPGQSTLGLPIIGNYKLRAYNDNGSWVYDANLNSYSIVKSATGNPGAFNLFVTNPMNGLSEEDRAGKAVAYEFKISMPVIDTDLDGILSTSSDVGRATSSVAGHITLGIGSGSNGNATPNTSMISLFRVEKIKNKFNTFGFSVYGHANGKLTSYSNDDSRNNVFSGQNSGQIVTVKVVFTPDANGIVTKQQTYINGTLKDTRTYDGTANTKTSMAYPLAKIDDTNNNYNGLSIFTQKYVQFSYQYSDNALHNMMFSDFNAYLVDATN